jgi:uncharacterized protein (TIGR02646 family)
MRPVERGAVPLQPNGTAKVYTDYVDARKDLIDRMGEFCSYCNMHLNTSLAVEHVQPKDQNPSLALTWTNFLLACTNCNSIKGSRNIDATNLNDYYWPDLHNTHLPFVYDQHGRVGISPFLSAPQRQIAQNTLDLFGLQRYPNLAQASDRRWVNRKQAYDYALEMLADLPSFTPTQRPLVIRYICNMAYESGFFSVWFEVFQAHDDIRAALINRFQGTATDAFDPTAHYNPVPRTAEM